MSARAMSPEDQIRVELRNTRASLAATRDALRRIEVMSQTGEHRMLGAVAYEAAKALRHTGGASSALTNPEATA